MLRFPVNRKKYPDVPFKSFTLRTTTGEDEEEAQVMLASKKERGIELAELVKRSIEAIDDKHVQQPFNQFDRWPTRTRNIITKAFSRMNGLTEKSFDEDFFAHAQEVSAESISASQPDDDADEDFGEAGSE